MERDFFDVDNFVDSLSGDLDDDCYVANLKTKGLNLDDADFSDEE